MKTIITILFALFTQNAAASHVEACLIDLQVSEASPIQSKLINGEYTQVLPLKGIVKKVQRQPGSYVSCQHMLDKELNLDVQSVSLENLVVVGKNHQVQIDYFYANSRAPQGIFETTRATLVTEAEKAYEAALLDSDVFQKMSDLRVSLRYGQDPVVVLKSNVQSLPEGFCGVVGCASTYLVNITMGQKYMNSSRETLLVRVDMDAFGQVTNIEIL